MCTTTIKSRLTPAPIPFWVFVSNDVRQQLSQADQSTADSIAHKWAEIIQLKIDVSEMKLQGIEPAPKKAWIEVRSCKGKKLATVRSPLRPVFNGNYQLSLGEANSYEHKDWIERVKLRAAMEKLESLAS